MRIKTRYPQRRVHSIGKSEYHDKLRTTKLAERNPQWKGDNVGYASLHEWVRNHKRKPDLCKKCKKHPPYDLTNISGKYKRDLNDWEWLCRKCHMENDGRMLKLISMPKVKKAGPNKIKGWKRPDVSERNRVNNPNKLFFNPTLDKLRATRVMGFEIYDGASIRMYKLTSGEHIVCNFLTEKAIVCLGLEHAHWVFENCINSLKRMIGIGIETNKYN